MQRQSRTSCSLRCASSLGPHMLGRILRNVGGTAVPVVPATLVQAADSTRGLAAGCMRDRAEACTLARAAACTPAQAAECMLVLEEVSTLGLGVDSMPALGVESILARLQMMATKVHGGLASREPKAANGSGRTVLTETLSCLSKALNASIRRPLSGLRPRRAAHVKRSAAKSYKQGRARMCSWQ